jgi:hypothetical protein
MQLTLAIGRRFTIVVATAALAGCGTFQLASGVFPLSPKTQEQQQLDNLNCKDQAKLAANTTERQTGAFLLGLTIVGAPVAFELEKAKQREVYKSCMEGKGYRVLPPNEPNSAATAAPGSPSPPQQSAPPVNTPEPPKPTLAAPPQAPSPNPAGLPLRDEAAQLLKLRALRDKGLITEAEYEKKRKEILDRL